MRFNGVAVLSAILALGCSSSKSSTADAAGAAGADAAGGTTGADAAAGAGTGGAGMGGGGVGAPPACLRDLFAGCATDGTCVFEAGDAGTSSGRWCYASGVKMSTTGSGCSQNPSDSAVTVVTKADGTLCYTVESQLVYGHACETGMSTWKDAAGTIVATAQLGSGIGNLPYVHATCSNGGELGEYTPKTQACTPGVCP